MSVMLATKTIDMINRTLETDQGSAYRGWLGKVIPHMDDAYRTGDETFRTHLGVSQIGEECARKLFYGWRWCTKSFHKGQTIRLFNRGHLEEARFVALLLSSGMKVWQQDEEGKQFRISMVNGHFGSAVDGVVMGCPDIPQGQACLTEMKTHNDKSFKLLVKEGVKVAKWEHYTQIQVYMRKLGLAVTLYLAVNKNTDELYGEILYLDIPCADTYIDRGSNIVVLDNPPERISETGSFYKCKWCEHNSICHMDRKPEINCRTCANSRPLEDGTWRCYNPEIDKLGVGYILSKEEQLKGCEDYSKARYYGDN